MQDLGNPFEHRQTQQAPLTALDLIHPAQRPTAKISELLAVQATAGTLPSDPPANLPPSFTGVINGHCVVSKFIQ